MPIAGLVNLIAAQANKANSAIIEPAKRNNARLRIVTGNLLKLLQKQFPNDTGYLETVGKALAGDVYPLDVAFTPPSISTEARKVIGRNNITVNYGGYTTFGAASCSFYNFIGVDTYKFFYRWSLLPGALILSVNDVSLEPAAPSEPLPVPDLSASATGYKVNATISQYYNYAAASADDIEYNRWVLQGFWPSSVTTSGFDLGNDFGSIVQTNVEFTVDLCLPVGVAPPRATPRATPA
jgi:hypothetical protein